MIEAMACGLPVLAFGAGSVPEVIDDGVTGLIVQDEDEAVRRFGEVDALDRREVRRRFDRRFSATAMARGYLDVYADRLARAPFAAESDADFDDEKPRAQGLAQIA